MNVQGWIRERWRSVKSIDYTREIVTGIVLGGIVSSIIFVTISPLFIPTIQDVQVEQGWIDTPQPSIQTYHADSVEIQEIRNSTSVNISGERYQVYFVKVKNPADRVLREVNFAVLFDGCPVSQGVWLTNLDSGILSTNAEEIDTERIVGGCGIDTDIEELPPKQSAIVYAVVNVEEENTQVEPRLSSGESYLIGYYEWVYNGRTYFEGIEQKKKVTQEFENATLLN